VLGIPLIKVLQEELGYLFNSNDFDNASPIEGSKEGIAELKKENDLYIITGRASNLYKRTENWIGKNFENTFKGIRFADFHPFEPNQDRHIRPSFAWCHIKNK
jgi:hypothetical protein